MTTWFCHSCKKTWSSSIQTPESVKNIRCFYCMKNTSVRVKKDKATGGRLKYKDYDKNTREFRRVRNGKNHKKQK